MHDLGIFLSGSSGGRRQVFQCLQLRDLGLGSCLMPFSHSLAELLDASETRQLIERQDHITPW